MLLVDTSVWVDHLRRSNATLTSALEEGRVLMHPFVLGELACGNLNQRNKVLRLLAALPTAPVATHPEVLAFIERRRLMGRGVGYIDAHLLASVVLTGAAVLWTLDKRLQQIAEEVCPPGN